ncbi:MAG: AbgT family transporter [Bacteriovoracia bacterium]
MDKKQAMGGFLDFVEKAGNKLPDPFTLFFGMASFVLLLSLLMAGMGVEVVSPADGSIIKVINLLEPAGIRKIMTEIPKNFALFPPFAVVLVCMVGIGVAEKSGLISAALKKTVTIVPSSLLPATLVFAGVMSNMASDAGYVVLTPLGAVLFAAFGRHPIAGLTAAFAGVSGGFSANLLLSSLDPLLSGLSTTAAQLVDKDYTVLPTANYYFMIASTFLITVVGSLITTKIVEPRLGPWEGGVADDSSHGELTMTEKKGLWWSAGYVVLFAIILLLLTVPQNAILRDETGDLKPFYGSIVPLIMTFFLGAGLVFGIKTRTITSDRDVNKMISETMAGLGPFIALVFIMAQFVAFFGWSNIGIVIAIKGAAILKTIGLTGFPLLFCFIIVTAFLNLFMGSASAKWAIMAPVFVPMFMLMGYSPEIAQNSYRIGDSVTNIISPLLPYYPIIIAFARKYKSDLGVGTLISLMIPYSLAFLVTWTILFAVWFVFGLPIGPDAPIFYSLPQ